MLEGLGCAQNVARRRWFGGCEGAFGGWNGGKHPDAYSARFVKSQWLSVSIQVSIHPARVARKMLRAVRSWAIIGGGCRQTGGAVTGSGCR